MREIKHVCFVGTRSKMMIRVSTGNLGFSFITKKKSDKIN